MSLAKTEADLASRLASQRRIPAASSFYNRKIAEASISEAIASEQSNINTWLNTSYRRYVFNYTYSENVGISLYRRATGAVDVRSLTIVIEKDSGMLTGYKIITAFPE